MPVFRAIFLVFLVAATFWAILRTKSAIDFRENYLESPEAKKMIEYHGVRMKQGDFVLHYLVEERVNSLAASLVQRDSITLWGFLYALYGMLGNYLFYLMRLVRSEKPKFSGAKAATRFAVRLTLASLCGYLCFLLIRPLTSPLGEFFGGWISKETPGSEGWTIHSVSDSFLFFPVLAGASIGSFYERLDGLLKATMRSLEHGYQGK